jgi:TolC family type I secretion outer membrane protein
MRKFIIFFIFTLIFLPLSAQEIPAGAQLSLEDCINLTLRHNPSLKAASLTTQVQQNKLAQTRSNYFPQVNGNASYSRSNQENAAGWGDAQNGYSSSVSASQLIYDFGKTNLSNKIQKNNVYSSKQDEQSTINEVIYKLKQAYYGVLNAEESRNVYAQSVEQYQEQLKRAKAFYEVGTRPKIDVTTAEVNLNNAKLNLIKGENSLKTAYYNLTNVMGIYDQNPSFTLVNNGDIPEYNITIDEALKEAQNNRPDLLSLQLKLENAKQNVSLAKTGYAPSLTANGSYGWSGQDFPLYDRWSVGAGINVPIFSGLSTYNQVKESKNSMQIAYENLTAKQQSILLDVKTCYFNLEEAKTRIPVAELSKQQAQENYDLAVGRYKVGVGNYIEVKDAETTLSNAKLSYINAVFDYNLAIANLERAIGKR